MNTSGIKVQIVPAMLTQRRGIQVMLVLMAKKEMERMYGINYSLDLRARMEKLVSHHNVTSARGSKIFKDDRMG